MNSKFTLTKNKRLLLATVVICAVLIPGLAILLQSNKVSEAALVDPHPGLVGWWRFDEGTGTVAADSSGNGNNGTIYGATWVTGKYGHALSFDGTNKYADISIIPALPNSLTIEAWIYPVGLSIGGSVISQRANGGAYNWVLYLDSSGRPRFQTYDGTNYPNAQGSPLPLNAWYHVAGMRNGTNLLLYINGQLVASTPDTTSGNDISSGAQSAYIGDSPMVTSLGFNGTIDNVRIFNRALSVAEIQNSYQNGPDLSSMLLANVPKGTTEFIATVSWQGIGSINVTIQSPSQNYTEDVVPVYQKTTYSTSDGTTAMLNIKRLDVSIGALASDQNWYIILVTSNVQNYKMTVEVQK